MVSVGPSVRPSVDPHSSSNPGPVASLLLFCALLNLLWILEGEERRQLGALLIHIPDLAVSLFAVVAFLCYHGSLVFEFPRQGSRSPSNNGSNSSGGTAVLAGSRS